MGERIEHKPHDIKFSGRNLDQPAAITEDPIGRRLLRRRKIGVGAGLVATLIATCFLSIRQPEARVSDTAAAAIGIGALIGGCTLAEAINNNYEPQPSTQPQAQKLNCEQTYETAETPAGNKVTIKGPLVCTPVN